MTGPISYVAGSRLADAISEELGLIASTQAIETAERGGWIYLRTTLLKPGEGLYIHDQAVSAGFRGIKGGYRRAESSVARSAQSRLDGKYANSEQGLYEAATFARLEREYGEA